MRADRNLTGFDENGEEHFNWGSWLGLLIMLSVTLVISVAIPLIWLIVQLTDNTVPWYNTPPIPLS